MFQQTKRGPFRLTQQLYADDKRGAEQRAADLYAGCQGALTVLSAVEYQAALDDASAMTRTRVAPKPEGQKRPDVKRGWSYGICVYCGDMTVARGGRAPKYCPSHNTRSHVHAFRRGQLNLLESQPSAQRRAS